MTPSTERADAVDADSSTLEATGRPRTIPASALGFAITATPLALAFFVHRYVVGPDEPLVLEWTPTPMDWLFALSLVAFAWTVLVPTATNASRRRRFWRSLRADPLALACAAYLAAFVLVGTIGGPVVTTCGPFVTEPLRPPGTLADPLGTNAHGESVLTLLVEGARVSTQVAFVVAMLMVPTALAVGTVAGYAGGTVDATLMRYVDVQETIPVFVFYLVLGYVFDYSLPLLVLVFGLLGWGGVARLVRAEVRQIREQTYVEAATSCGCRPIDVLRRHVLPNAAGTAITETTQVIAWLLLVEAALSFMRLTDPNVASLGHTISRGFIEHGGGIRFLDIWWISTIPTIVLAGTVLSFSVLADRLRETLDPR